MDGWIVYKGDTGQTCDRSRIDSNPPLSIILRKGPCSHSLNISHSRSLACKPNELLPPQMRIQILSITSQSQKDSQQRSDPYISDIRTKNANPMH